jgi:AcrR family transcriptional regulator
MDKRKKERILETATDIFSRFGIKKSTMDEIAQKVRMGKSTLYHYFKSKEEIFLEVVKRESDTLKENLKKEVEKAITPQNKFRAYAKARMKYLKELINYYNTLTDAYLEIYPFTKDIQKDFENFELNSLSAIFKEGIEKDVFNIPNPKLAARMVMIAFKGFEYLYFIKEQPTELEGELDNLIDMFFKGIEKA